MKLDFGETYGEHIKRMAQWHKWFAFHPVQVGPHDYRWLEYVQKKGIYTYNYTGEDWKWSYKSLNKGV